MICKYISHDSQVNVTQFTNVLPDSNLNVTQLTNVKAITFIDLRNCIYKMLAICEKGTPFKENLWYK